MKLQSRRAWPNVSSALACLPTWCRTKKPGGRVWSVAYAAAGERPALLFSGHLDTVPAGENWQHDILAAEVSDGKIWGLGTTDMKSGVAAMIVAMEAIRRTGVPLKGDLLFAGTAGEEVDSMGAQRLVQQQKLSDVGFMVIGEPTTNRVFTAEKGVLWLELNTKGKTAHGSMPHLGVNAIMHMNKLLQALAAATSPTRSTPCWAISP